MSEKYQCIKTTAKDLKEIYKNETMDKIFEDFAEALNDYQDFGCESCKAQDKLEEKIADLEHQLSNCLESKFKIGQEVWSIFISQYFKDCKEICNLEITAIMKCNNGIYYQGYVLEQGKNRSDYWFNEKNTFLTEAEAKEKLEELKREN